MTDNELKEDCLQEAGIDLGRYSHTEMTQIKDALRRYLNAKLKLLRIADVSGRSEQLVCSCDKWHDRMEKYNVQKVFDRYKENENLKEADIFHLYDTGEECLKDNTGYHDSRHFRLVGFNTQTMEKCELGRHDGLESFSDNLCIRKIRVYADGSFFISLSRPAKLHLFQCVSLD